jgi:two-component system phosphate regulon sensor histidine kinase PhoR
MPTPAVSFRRLARAVAALAAPTAAVMAALAASGLLSWWAALLGTGLVAAVIAIVVRRHLAGLESLRQQVENLARNRPHGAEIAVPLASAAELSAALAALRRMWVRHSDELKALLSANEAILDSIPDPMLLMDGARRITRANAASRDLLGAAVVGRDLDTVLRDPAVLQAVDEVVAGRASSATEFTVPGPVERHFEARVVRLPAATSGGAALLAAFHEVTAIRRAERMRADFVANVSHELRTPLATLIGFIETLRGAAREDAQARDRFLGIMHDQTSRMSRIVRDLLSLSRIEEDEHTPPTARIALAPILNSVADALVLQARAKNIAIVVDAPAELPPVIGDADQLAQVFQNLIDNAVKYGRPHTKVRVTARPAQRPGRIPAGLQTMVAVAVADEGEGIPREHLPRLTERFYRVDAGRSRQLGGTGLGLAIVKHIVNRHRGALTIESKIGRGSLFTVYLPAAASAGAISTEKSD